LQLKGNESAIGLIDRVAGCFHDVRGQNLIEHEVVTLVGQRVLEIAPLRGS
jgi:hypothetical protein